MSNRALAERILPEVLINKTSAQMILSSVTPYGAELRDLRKEPTRLDSIYGVFPKFVMVERNRHRGFSLSDRSSRAVPPEKLIAEIRSGVGLAMPAKFRKRTGGMGGGEELVGDELIAAQLRWIVRALDGADAAEEEIKYDMEKEVINRHLDPYIYAHTLQTGTRDIWLNFFGLRLANASPTIELFAQKCFEVYKATTPKVLQPGEWHTPFIDEDPVTLAAMAHDLPAGFKFTGWYGEAEMAIRLSAARCAHLSFNDLETGQRMTVKKALEICDRLEGSRPLHASPFEHQATPDEAKLTYGPGEWDKPTLIDHWKNPKQHGNLYGWRQARKMLSGEAVAELPEGYEL